MSKAAEKSDSTPESSQTLNQQTTTTHHHSHRPELKRTSTFSFRGSRNICEACKLQNFTFLDAFTAGTKIKFLPLQKSCDFEPENGNCAFLWMRIIGKQGSQAQQFQNQGVKVEVPGKNADSCEVKLFYYDESAFENVKFQLLDMLQLNELSEEELIEANFHVPEHLRGKLIGPRGQTLRELEQQLGCSISIPERGLPDAMLKAVIAHSKIAQLQEALTFNLGFPPEIQVRRYGETTLQQWQNKRKSLQECGTKRKWSETESSTKTGPPKKKACSQIPLLLDNFQNEVREGLSTIQQQLEQKYAQQQEEFKAHCDVQMKEQASMFEKKLKKIRDAYAEEYRDEIREHEEENSRLRKELADAKKRTADMEENLKKFGSAMSACGFNFSVPSLNEETQK